MVGKKQLSKFLVYQIQVLSFKRLYNSYFRISIQVLLYTVPMNINGYVPILILLYTLPMNINGYDPFLINTSDTIVMGLICWLSSTPLVVVYLLHTAGE